MALDDDIPDALVRSAQRGDRVALSRLFDMVRPRLYRWAFVQTSTADDAEDIVQETSLRAARHVGEFSFDARFTTWLHTILRRTAADWRRTNGRRARLLQQHHNPSASTTQPEPDSNLIGVVREIMNGLSARQREILDLVDLQEYEPTEAAELLGLNPATVRVHLMRARRVVRSRLLDDHPWIAEDRNA